MMKVKPWGLVMVVVAMLVVVGNGGCFGGRAGGYDECLQLWF